MKLIMTRGLPGSGKSFWAKEQVLKSQGYIKRFNKDDMRSMIDSGKWSKTNEKFILKLRDTAIVFALLNGHSVIVDDCNLAPKHEVALRNLVEEHNSDNLPKLERCDFEIKDFTDVTVDECIKRDAKRAIPVGSSVIMGMYNQFLRPAPKKVIFKPNLPNVIICDIDGTLALFDKANPYDRDFSQDVVNEPVKQLLSKMVTQVILFSGRKGIYKKQTKDWLDKNGILYTELYMRPDDDTRDDTILKKEFYDNYIVDKYNVLFVVDDRKKVKRMWVDNGLFVMDVNQNDAEF